MFVFTSVVQKGHDIFDQINIILHILIDDDGYYHKLAGVFIDDVHLTLDLIFKLLHIYHELVLFFEKFDPFYVDNFVLFELFDLKRIKLIFELKFLCILVDSLDIEEIQNFDIFLRIIFEKIYSTISLDELDHLFAHIDQITLLIVNKIFEFKGLLYETKILMLSFKLIFLHQLNFFLMVFNQISYQNQSNYQKVRFEIA